MLQASDRGVEARRGGHEVADLAADGHILVDPDVDAAPDVAAIGVLAVAERVGVSVLEEFAGVVLRVAEATGNIGGDAGGGAHFQAQAGHEIERGEVADGGGGSAFHVAKGGGEQMNFAEKGEVRVLPDALSVVGVQRQAGAEVQQIALLGEHGAQRQADLLGLPEHAGDRQGEQKNLCHAEGFGTGAQEVTRLFPGALGNDLITVLDAIIDVAAAGAAEGGVVEAGGPESLGEIFLKSMDGFEVFGEGRVLVAVRGEEEHLVAAVHEAGDLLAAENAMFGDFGLAVGNFFDDRGAAFPGDEMPAGDAFSGEALDFGSGEAIGKGDDFFRGELEEHVSPL